MNEPAHNMAFDEELRRTLESNKETQKEIARVLAELEETKKKKETVFKAFGITPEMEKEKLSPSDLSSGERKIFDVMEREFVAELSAKGIEVESEKTKESRSKANLTLSRKRLRI